MALETERTDAEAPLCAFCSTPMKGRRPQAKFCSDACRTRSGRVERDRRVATLLDTLVGAVEGLRRELGSSVVDRPSQANDDVRPEISVGDVK
jgi:hypothetical protein